jgi:hypothetical protein
MKLLASILAILFAGVPLAGAAQSRPVRVTVPGGMVIPVRVLGSLSSANEKPGDTFQVQAAHDVIVNGMVVVSAGAEGQGTIQLVDSAGGNGHSGTLALNFDWIYSVDGGKIHLSNGAQKQSEEDRKGASSTATIVGVATFGIGGLFGHNLAHGKDVVIDGSKDLSAFVERNVHVMATEHASQDQYDH